MPPPAATGGRPLRHSVAPGEAAEPRTARIRVAGALFGDPRFRSNLEASTPVATVLVDLAREADVILASITQSEDYCRAVWHAFAPNRCAKLFIAQYDGTSFEHVIDVMRCAGTHPI